MGVTNVRELARNTSKVVGRVKRTKRAEIVTQRGIPVAALIAIDAAELEDWVLANAPEFVRSRAAADQDLALGRTVSLDDYLARRKR